MATAESTTVLDLPRQKKSKSSKAAEVTEDASADLTREEKKRKRAKDAQAEAGLDKAERKRRKKEKAAAAAAEEGATITPEETGTTVTPAEETPVPESKEERRKRKKEKRAKREALAQSQSELPASAPLVATLPTPPETSASTPTPSEVTAYLAKNNITIHAPSEEVTPILKFSQLASYGVDPRLIQATDKFKEPSLIQACSWPASLRGDDVVGIAETGSGKTLAFGLPALQHILKSSPTPASDSKKSKKSKKHQTATEITTLVVAPTRELAIQTHETLHELGAPFGIGSVCLYGGEPKDGQRKTLLSQNGDGRTTRIVVGTPGRLKDFMEEGVCDLSRATYLVLDEADRMLDKGFENDIRTIIEKTAPMDQRQTLMFSATWPESVRRLASTFQRNPVRVTVGKDELQANSRVEQVVEVFDDVREKDKRLIQRLKELGHKPNTASPDRVLIFALYKKECDRVTQSLAARGFHALAIHGDLGQAQRMKALEDFKTARTTLLVATDVAARGLDIPEVKAVVNYTFPLTVEEYIHRIGRTGRGGRSGKSITFFTGADHERALAGEFARVLKDNGFDAEPLKKFPMTIKKKTHGSYGAFFRDDIPADADRLPRRLLSDPGPTTHVAQANRESEKSDTHLTSFALIDSFLLKQNCTACAPIFALVDPTTEDTFFVNAQLLVIKLSIQASNEGDGLPLSRSHPTLEGVTFIIPDEPPQALASPPEPLHLLLEALCADLPLSSLETTQLSVSGLPEVVLLPNDSLNPHVQVPLAGILLDYPIAYVPMSRAGSQDNPSYLNGHALDVFDICLRPSRNGDPLELMKFSCPAEFLLSESSATRNLNALRQHLEVVIQNLNSNVDGGDGPHWEVVFTHSQVIMDRVAL